jgi:hypothetical protein
VLDTAEYIVPESRQVSNVDTSCEEDTVLVLRYAEKAPLAEYRFPCECDVDITLLYLNLVRFESVHRFAKIDR